MAFPQVDSYWDYMSNIDGAPGQNLDGDNVLKYDGFQMKVLKAIIDRVTDVKETSHNYEVEFDRTLMTTDINAEFRMLLPPSKEGGDIEVKEPETSGLGAGAWIGISVGIAMILGGCGVMYKKR